jgi:hypothetical protein
MLKKQGSKVDAAHELAATRPRKKGDIRAGKKGGPPLLEEVHSVSRYGWGGGGGGGGRWQRQRATGQDAPTLYVPKGNESMAWSGMRRDVVCADALVWLAKQVANVLLICY